MSLNFLLTGAIIVVIYYLLALGLNCQYGLTGIINFGVAGFFGLGAYTTGILINEPTAGIVGGYDLPMAVGMLLSVLLSAAVGLGLAYLVVKTDVKTRSQYVFPLVTLAFGEFFRTFVTSENWFANGYVGLRSLPRPFAFVFERYGQLPFTLVFCAMLVFIAGVVTLAMNRISRSSYGRSLRMIKDDELVAQSLGYNPALYQMTIFAIGSAVMGLAGSLWALYLGNVQPTSFYIEETILVWVAVIVGGRGNNYGALVGTVLIFGVLNQGTRLLPSVLGSNLIPSARMIFIGLVFVAVLIGQPRGLLPDRKRTIDLPA